MNTADTADTIDAPAGSGAIPPDRPTEAAGEPSMRPERPSPFRFEGNPTASFSPLAAALAHAKKAFPPIPRNREVQVTTRTGGSYKFRYATLDAIINAVTEPLAIWGLSIVQDTEWGEGALAIGTTLMHESGEYLCLARMQAETTVESVDRDGEAHRRPMSPQELGSLVTYMRRYSLTTALNLAAEEDDDANLATGNQATVTRETAPPPPRAADPEVEKAINACGTLEALADYWGKLPDEVRHRGNAAVKDARKKALTSTASK